MAKYTNTASTFDVGNVGFTAGDGYVRCGPETNCEYVCSDIPEDGLVTVSGCGGLLDCEIEINDVPCIDDVKECGPCHSTCSGGTTTGEPGVGLDATEVTALIEEQAPALIDACLKETLPAMIAEKS